MWRLIVYAAIISCLGFSAPAQSPNKPGATERIQPPPAQADAPNQPAAEDKRRTADSPVVVKVLTAPKANAETTQDAQEREEKSTNDRRLVIFTGLLFAAAVFQFLAMIAQFVAMAVQARRLRETVGEMKTATDAARDAADAAKEQSGHLEASLIFAREEFTATKRPYLFVTDIKNLRVETVPTEDGEDDWGSVSYVVANHSDIPAIIETVRLFLSTSTTGNPFGDCGLAPHPDLLNTKIFPPHHVRDVKDWAASGLKYLDRHEEGPPIELSDGNELFFYIVIKYRGPFSKGHETSACWKIGADDYLFSESGGAEFNYVR
jgi:hypothetical protein